MGPAMEDGQQLVSYATLATTGLDLTFAHESVLWLWLWQQKGKWPVGFAIAGSSIEEMNGLYIHLGERDDSLPSEGIQTWGNLGSPWVIANVDARSYKSLGSMPMEWVLYDGEGVARFAHQGGAYLPGSGEEWKHLRREPFARRLRRGDRVFLKAGHAGDGLDGPRAGRGVVTRAPRRVKRWEGHWRGTAHGNSGGGGGGSGLGGEDGHELEKEPIFWRRDADGAAFRSAAWQLELEPGQEGAAAVAPGGGGGRSSGSRGGSLAVLDDPDELPWQVRYGQKRSSTSDQPWRQAEQWQQGHRPFSAAAPGVAPPRRPCRSPLFSAAARSSR